MWWWNYLKEVQGYTEVSARMLVKLYTINSVILCGHFTFNIETWKCASDFDYSGDKYQEDMIGEYGLENPFNDEDEDGTRVEVEVEG